MALDAQAVVARNRASLMSMPGVSGVGTSRDQDGNPVILLLLSRPLDVREALPTSVEGVRVVTRVIGQVRPLVQLPIRAAQVTAAEPATQARTSKVRPAPPGVSIGNPRITAGTLGVVLQVDGWPYILSNWHVLAADNEAAIGEPVTQPGKVDGGADPRDRIARLASFIPMEPDGINVVDMALARVDDPSLVDESVLGLGEPSGGFRDPDAGERVAKSGRTTGVTRGLVLSNDMEVRTFYEGIGPMNFSDQLVIEGDIGPYVQGGDSGSAVFDAEMNLAGLIFAGTEGGLGVANRASKVMQFVTGGLPPVPQEGGIPIWAVPLALGVIGFISMGGR